MERIRPVFGIWELLRQHTEELGPASPVAPTRIAPGMDEEMEYEERRSNELRIDQEAQGRVYGQGFRGSWFC